jgi:hypothetical protein
MVGGPLAGDPRSRRDRSRATPDRTAGHGRDPSGASIKQLLTATLDEGTDRWLSIAATDSGFALRLHDVLDDGRDDFLDVYELRPADEDDYVREGRLLGTFPDVPSTFAAATRNGARMTVCWVNSGVVQDEYADLRSAD